MRNIKYLLFVFTILFLFTYCKKEQYQIDRPVIERGEYSPELQIAISKITSGVEYVIEFGHVWDTTPYPADNLNLDCSSNCSKYYNTSIPNDTIEIISKIENLTPETTYFIQAYAVDSFGNKFTSPQQIEYNSLNSPVACFEPDEYQCEVGDCFIGFDASCASPYDTENLYKWDFDGDNIYDEGRRGVPTIHHNYSVANAYSVKLRVISPKGLVDDTIQTIQVYEVGEILSACFSTDTIVAGVGEAISFDASCSENAVSYQWDLDGDGIFGPIGNDISGISHAYYKSGTYEVMLKVFNITGAVDEITQTITVNPPKFRITLHRMLCEEVGDNAFNGIDQYSGYISVHLYADGVNQTALNQSSGVDEVDNQYRMWNEDNFGGPNTIQLREGEAFVFEQWLEYELNATNINTAQMEIYTSIYTPTFALPAFVGDEEIAVNLATLEVDAIFNVIQSVSGNGSIVEMDISIIRTQ